jgi:hypothetical protein
MWIRVLSQTEHTQKLLQDPAWEGQTMVMGANLSLFLIGGLYCMSFVQILPRHFFFFFFFDTAIFHNSESTLQ